MTRSILISAATVAALLMGGSYTSTAGATDPSAGVPTLCGKRADIVDKLARQYDEQPAALGQLGPHTALEVFVSQRGTFTILATKTDGTSCIVSIGEGWQETGMTPGRGA